MKFFRYFQILSYVGLFTLFSHTANVYAKNDLLMPRCGYLSASQEFNSNASIYWSFLLGTIGQPFETTYLTGCKIPHLEVNLPKYIQQYDFLYNSLGFIKGGSHRLKDQWNRQEKYSVFTIDYYPNQLVKKFSHLCSSGYGEENLDFIYDNEDRLLTMIHRRPANCFESSSALYKTQSFEYGIKELPQMPSKGKIIYRFPKAEQFDFHVEYDYDSLKRVVSKRELISDGTLFQQSVIYDRAGNVIEKTMQRTKNQRTLDKKHYKYQYDNLGRLIQMRLPQENKSWNFSYSLNGNLKTLIIPNPDFTPSGDTPYHLRFDF